MRKCKFFLVFLPIEPRRKWRFVIKHSSRALVRRERENTEDLYSKNRKFLRVRANGFNGYEMSAKPSFAIAVNHATSFWKPEVPLKVYRRFGLFPFPLFHFYFLFFIFVFFFSFADQCMGKSVEKRAVTDVGKSSTVSLVV